VYPIKLTGGHRDVGVDIQKMTGGTHKSYGVDTEGSKRTQNFGVDRKFRGTHSFGRTQSYGVNTQLWSEQKVPQWTKFRGGYKVSEWTHSYGNSVSYAKEFANY